MRETRPPGDLSAWDAAEAIEAERLCAEDLVRSCLDQIEELEPTIHA